jgi:DNA mismatch repair protein MutL
MSNIIKLLPDSVANQIAAGEVIQRPASAVKELLENAVDAGASLIELHIKDAGKTLIQVVDNGCGMSPIDGRMSFERHATSKIENADDLFAIRTMGFRGEALASIAAIAHIELKTKPHEEELGYCINIEGSKIINEEPCPCKSGTSIAVKNLFFNVPARRNFLKSDNVETRHIIDEFTRVALVHYNIAFNMTHNAKPVFKLPKSSLKSRIVNIFGNHYDQRLLPVEISTSMLKVNGFIGKPQYAKKTRGEQYFFVNGRFIKHPYLHHAVENAFAELLPSDAYPSYFLNIEIDPVEIDINIHPTKTEVNFRDSRFVYGVIQSAVKQSIGKHNLTPTIDFDIDPAIDAVLNTKSTKEIKQPEVKINSNYNPFDSKNSVDKSHHKFNKKGDKNWEKLYDANNDNSNFEAKGLQIETEEHFNNESRFFQIHNKYIITNVRSGLMIIDQKKAHERILYELFLKKLENNTPASQQQLFPVTISFSPHDAAIINTLKDTLTTLGFTFEISNNNKFIFQGVPEGIQISELEDILEKIIETYKNESENAGLNKNIILARSLASRMAIKTGKRLSVEEMANIFDTLFACSLPEVAPDGSNIVTIIQLNEIDKLLKEKNK